MTIDLILVRHARARDKAKWAEKGRRDSDRPITGKAREDFQAQALGLSLLVGKVERIITSPFTRCLQTAKILTEELSTGQAPLSLKVLTPGTAPEKVLSDLEQFERGAVIMVGHEPELSAIIDQLLSPNYLRNWTELKKGSAVKLTFSSRIKPGQGRLSWYLKPKALRELGYSFTQSFQNSKKAVNSPILKSVN